MAKGNFGGFPGGNMQQMLKQAQKMQKQAADLQAELEGRTLDVSGGGGAVKLTITGKKELVSITIDPAAVDPDDVETLQDLVLAAVNEGVRQADEMFSREMGRLTGGAMPGMF